MMRRGGWWHSANVLVSSLSLVSREGAALDVATIHDSHADFVWSTLQRLGVRSADLEDALQEVFIVVHRRLATFDGSSRLSTWLFGICLRVASALRRKAYRRRERTGMDLEGAAGASTAEGPDAGVLERQARARLEQVLDALEPGRRAVFVMFEVEGIGCAEIAAQLGLALGTVYSRLGAARSDFAKIALRLQRREGAENNR